MRSFLGPLLSAWNRGSAVPILLYHAVDDDEIDLSVSVETFRSHLDWLVENANVHPVEKLKRGLAADGLGKRPIVITFDDGYRSIYDHAFPMLAERSLPFGVFLTTALIDGSQELRGHAKPMLSWTQVLEMRGTGLLTTGSHTHTHAILSGVSPQVVRREIERSCAEIVRRLGEEPTAFAFPKGRYDTSSLAEVKKKFDLVFAGSGLCRRLSSINGPLPRINVVRGDSQARLVARLSPLVAKASRLASPMRRSR